MVNSDRTINNLISYGTLQLKEEKKDSPWLDSILCLSHLLGKTKEEILARGDDILDGDIVQEFYRLIELRKSGYPIAYILGKQEFMGYNFKVNKDVLIPRADTEILVYEIIKKERKSRLNGIKYTDMLDLCTGSGCIAVCVAKEIKTLNVLATDISESALKVAKYNAEYNKVDDRVTIEKSDMFDVLESKYVGKNFDIITANVPYIKHNDISSLQKEVQYEPQIALDGGDDGLDFYRTFAQNAYKYINPNGFIALEIGFDQASKVCEILEEQEKYKNIFVKKDYANNDRGVFAEVI